MHIINNKITYFTSLLLKLDRIISDMYNYMSRADWKWHSTMWQELEVNDQSKIVASMWQS